VSVLVDTNIISDLAYADSEWKTWSGSQLVKFAGQICINPVIYAELCVPAISRRQVEKLLAKLELEYVELPRDALFLAAKAFKAYRERGGTRIFPLPDFFIGAHAQASGIAILTRDASRYQTNFPAVQLICP